jgi:hypothetical protein
MSITGTIADLERQRGEAQAGAANIKTELDSLAVRRLRNEPEAKARSAELRGAATEAAQRIADLGTEIERHRHFAAIERQAQALAARHEAWRTLLDTLELRECAAAELDALVLQLAASIRVVDELGNRAFATATALLGASAIGFAAAPVHEEVTGQLVRYGVVERHLLLPRYVGELGHIETVAAGAARFAAQGRRLAPKDLGR